MAVQKIARAPLLQCGYHPNAFKFNSFVCEPSIIKCEKSVATATLHQWC